MKNIIILEGGEVPMRKLQRIIQKNACIIFILIAVIVLSACSKDSSNKTDNTQDDKELNEDVPETKDDNTDNNQVKPNTFTEDSAEYNVGDLDGNDYWNFYDKQLELADKPKTFDIKTDIDASIPIEEKDVYFFSKENKEVEKYIQAQEQGIKMILVYGEGLSEEGLTIGKPISVRNLNEYYYVPVFQNGKCIHIVNISKIGDEFNLQSSKGFADALNSLEPNSYYIESINNKENNGAGIFICGEGLKLGVEGIRPENFCKNFYKDGDPIVLNALEGENKIDVFEDVYGLNN